jgi:DNA polymerase
MKTYRIEPTLPSWRDAARHLLSAKVPPSEVIWYDGTGTPPLFTDKVEAADTSELPVIPRGFFPLAQLVACHREPERWSLLYEAAHRIAVGKERHLLEFAAEPLVRTLNQLAKAVSRDRHKMKAFVRFRKVGELPGGREQFVAWFEPEHHITELTAPFFAKRFASFDWSILTPDRCAHWNGEALTFTAGVSAAEAPSGDALEDYWKTYYASIFNPARLKLKAMQSEMPKKYWKNLPEATLIAELTSKATHRTNEMIERAPTVKKPG